eukprot:676226-Prymnesium_polylepis.1
MKRSGSSKQKSLLDPLSRGLKINFPTDSTLAGRGPAVGEPEYRRVACGQGTGSDTATSAAA